MEHAVIAMFDDFAQAQRAKDELLKAGFQANDVQMSPSDESEASRRSALGGHRDTSDTEDSGWSIGGFFKSLFGSDDDTHREHSDTYSEALRRGSFMVSVDATSEEQQERASAVLLNCDPVDIEGRSQAWRSQGWSGYDSSAPLYTQDDIARERQTYSTTGGAAGFDTHTTSASGIAGGADAGLTGTHRGSSLAGSDTDMTGTSGIGSGTDTRIPSTTDQDSRLTGSDTGMMGSAGIDSDSRLAGASGRDSGMSGTMEDQTRIPVVEESLKVGKRAVSAGGVRVFKRVTERPVEESINLRQEQVHVERRPVDRPIGEAGTDAFKEQSFELRETTEEPVVSKVARVVEEVEIGKEVTSRDETVRDTVRRTDVEVENLGAQNLQQGSAATGMGTDDSAYRSHWQNSFASSGGRYEDYAPAYQYGSTLASDERYRGHQWNDIEPHVRTDWESRNTGGTWERAKEAVRYGWEKMTH
jgi:uncharacterized protein (TIGR02271 family)